MKIIYIKGNLVELFGYDNAIRLTSKTGCFGNLIQITTDSLESFIECTDTSKIGIPGLTLLSVAEANAKILELFIPQYIIENEVLMNANINQLVTAGTLDLATFDGVWDSQQELQMLYETYNISGMGKTTPPSKLFTE